MPHIVLKALGGRSMMAPESAGTAVRDMPDG